MRKILSLLMVVLFAGSMMAATYNKTAYANLKTGDVVIITEQKNDDVYAASNDQGTSKAPIATAVTVANDAITTDATNILWTVEKDGNNISFQAGEDYLYCTSTNNGVRVGAGASNVFSIDATSGYLYNNGTSRYIGVYNGADWRCYTSVNSNITGQTLAFYVLAAEQGGEGGDDPQPTHTYTVAGDNATLFGTTWAPTNEDNDMTLVEGLYTWEKTNQTLPAGNVAFKVCEDHAWTVAYPASDYQLNIPEAGIYTITITYNPANNAVNAVAQKTGDAVVIPTVAMHGNFGGQNWADTENFAVAEGNETASLTLNLAAGDYEFGMRIGGSGNWTANGAAFTRENNSAVIEAGQGNITLDADAAGEYTFTWTYATNTLTITYPEFVPPTYTYADGYYLIGLDMQDWNMEYMPTEGRLFAANPDNEGEYQLTITLAADQQFKVVSVQKDQIKSWYPDGMDNNYIVDAAHAGEKTVYFRPDGQGGEGWHYGVIFVAANEEQPEQPEEGSVIVKWDADAEQVIGQVIYHAAAATASTKIHNNEDDVTAINLSKSYKYADDQYVVIKPATGTFKAGDKVTFNTFINNATADGSKYGAVYFYAADGATVLFQGQNGINGRTSNDEPVVENFTLEADQDSIMFGRYGNTATYVSVLNVTRVGGETPVETPKFYITGNAALVGQDKEWNPGAIPSMEDSKVLALEAGSYMMKITTNGAWEGENNVKGYDALTGEIPAGVTRGENENNDNICFTLAEAGDVTVTYTAESFTIAGNFYVAPKVAYYLIGDSAFVVDAGATADKAWTPDAIPSFNDTTVLNLKAGVDYIMRLSLNGSWENHRDFRHLTDTAAGLIELPDEFGNHSIGFSLNEAGPVTVIYIPATEEQPEVFKLIGDFYVAPAPDPTVAVMGSMNNWAAEIPFTLSDDKTYATLTVENITAGDYEFKFVVNGEWRSNGYTYHRGFPACAGITENNENMVFQADVTGQYTFYWYFANDSAAIVYPELPFACDWDNIEFLGDGSPEQTHANQYKLCKEGEYPGVVNVQRPDFAKESGIYVTFPSAAFGEISLPEGTYAIQGAGMILYCSAFDAQQETEVTVVCDNNPIVFTVYNANYTPAPPTGNIRLVPGVWNLDNAKFAAVTWHVGEAFENGTVSAWFEYLNADTLIGNVPNDADSIAFARFNSAAEVPSMDMSMIWNHTDKLLIDKQTMIYTISGWPEEGRDFCPGYWGEYVEPVYVLENGYYLVGNFSGVDAWSVEDLSAEKKFAANPDNEGEYQLAVNFAENDQVKVAYVENDQIIFWYPKGDNYTVDHSHAGPTSMYFRPDYFDDWNAFGGYFYIVPVDHVGVDNVDAAQQAVKMLREGQIMIIRGEHIYTPMGQMIK